MLAAALVQLLAVDLDVWVIGTTGVAQDQTARGPQQHSTTPPPDQNRLMPRMMLKVITLQVVRMLFSTGARMALPDQTTPMHSFIRL